MNGRPVLLLLVAALASPPAAEAQVRRDPLHYDVGVGLDPATARIDGTTRVTLLNLEPDEPVLELHPALTVERVAIDGETVRFHATRGDDVQRITALHDDRRVGSREVLVEYSGTLPDHIRSDGALLGPASRWYPRVAGFAAPATYRVSIRVPRGWDAVAAGDLEQRTEQGGATRTVAYRSPTPLPAGLHLLAGPWLRLDGHHGEVAIAVHAPASERHAAAAALPLIERRLAGFVERFGAYPYPRFAVVAGGSLPAGAEAVGDAIPGVAVLPPGGLDSPPAAEAALARHLARQWWGHGVAVDAARGDWSAGLVAYVADHHAAERRGPAAAAAYRREACRRFTERLGPPVGERPAADPGAPERAMMIFHMLERRLGGPRFEAVLRDVYRDFVHERASWDTWRAAFSRAAGEDLGWFFDQWVARPGAPELVLAEAAVIEGDPDLGMLRTQESSSYVELSGLLIQRGGPWRIRVPVEIDTAGRVYRRTVELDVPAARFRLTVPDAPRSLRVDPHVELFRRVDAAEMPAVLSRVLDDERVVWILGDPDRRAAAAYRKLAEALRRPGRDEVVEVQRVTVAQLTGASLLWLGPPPQGNAARLFRHLPARVELSQAGFTVEGQPFRSERASLLAVGPHPDDPARAVALFWGLSPGAIVTAGPRLRQHGDYSYVAFIDENAQSKGVVPGSPDSLAHRFGNPDRP